MATKNQALILLFSLLTISCSIIKPSHADCVSKEGIAVFWGQRSESDEGILQAACDTGNYKIVLLDYITVYEDGSDPTLNLASHCGWAGKPCTILESQIKYCQSKNIKVIASIGRDVTSKTSRTRTIINSAEAAKKLAAFLWNNYLSGQSGPLGEVALDGINIFEVSGGQNLQWDEIVKAIHEYSTTERKIYLSVSPQCVDAYLGDAIDTRLIDYAFVEFYYEPGCQYDTTNKDATKLLESWKQWISKEALSDKLVFLGLPASPSATGGGYVEPDVLKKDILPVVQQASNYGGILLLDRYWDLQTEYSNAIKEYVPTACRCVCDDSFPFHDQALALQKPPHLNQKAMHGI